MIKRFGLVDANVTLGKILIVETDKLEMYTRFCIYKINKILIFRTFPNIELFTTQYTDINHFSKVFKRDVEIFYH